MLRGRDGWLEHRSRATLRTLHLVLSSTLYRTATLGVLSISVIRYSDMPSASDWPRTSIVTLAAYLARWTAACPAEFAPPTTKTSWSVTALASDVAAP